MRQQVIPDEAARAPLAPVRAHRLPPRGAEEIHWTGRGIEEPHAGVRETGVLAKLGPQKEIDRADYVPKNRRRSPISPPPPPPTPPRPHRRSLSHVERSQSTKLPSEASTSIESRQPRTSRNSRCASSSPEQPITARPWRRNSSQSAPLACSNSRSQGSAWLN